MADDDSASRTRNRLTKESPEVALARDVARADLALRDGQRVNAEHPAQAERHWAELVGELRRLWERFTGRQQSTAAPTADGADTSYAPNTSYAPTVPYAATTPYPAPLGPRQPSASETAAHQERARLESRIDRLPPDSRRAFEDAMLRLVRSDDTLRAAFERSPQSIPTVAKYAVAAHYRESLRDRPQPAAEAAMNAARDRIMADDARQFAALRERWERPAPSPDRPPLAPPLLGHEGQVLLREQVATARRPARGTENGGTTSRPASPVPNAQPRTR
ncbi:hypothetical protein STRCI_007194 [Streptomyces cinnabarinus]|uniref:Uncharacterized protein n=1 Tax=Streptomyces cinnabarinus TaxID=67287 RepID=A0ABY7KQ46_9ACTN|nr:hypothetical protein [Streptomyces cinnabarinus]WAZ25683.1 hypothetical protein STRCI_007194 [Streptomyces cinnabarinus]